MKLCQKVDVFMLFNLLVLFAISYAKPTSWSDLGCTDEGFLSASHLPKALDGIEENMLSEFLQSTHPLAGSSCYGSHEVDESQDAQDFHLFWECYDQHKACLLPSVNIQTLKTLLHFHPTSKVTIWSNTLQKSLLEARISSPNLNLRRYPERFFSSLPPAALQASKDIPKFFDSNVESQSHYSDLMRMAVLYKFGGIYVDFDSLWVNSVNNLTEDPEWIPFTRRKLDGFPLIDGQGFLEGGIMKLPKHSLFARKVLETFPEYTQEVANCWACVGPKHLTEVYVQLSQDDNLELPHLVDSSLVYGDEYYRANLGQMYSTVDVKVLSKAASTGAVAFHLFTSSGERFAKPHSMIEFFFKVSDASGDAATQHVPLGALSKRRRAQENSVDYEIVDSMSFEADFEAEIRGREQEFCQEWNRVVRTTCIDVAAGSVIVTHGGTSSEIQRAREQIEAAGGLDLSPAFRAFTLIVEEATTTQPSDEAATSGGSSGGDSESTVLLVIIAVAALFLVLGFYGIYRIWQGPKKSKRIKQLTDSHVQYIENEPRYDTAPVITSVTETRTPYEPPHNLHDEKPQTMITGSWEGGYQKREPQSSYIREDHGGYLVDEDEQVYGGNAYHREPYGRSHSNMRYDYDAGVIHPHSNVGGGYTDEAYFGGLGGVSDEIEVPNE